jgi:alkaline phosphatase D
VSYRLAQAPASYENAVWQSVGAVYTLGNDTDYTTAVTFALPNYPDRVYQWTTSNNHTGYFKVPPKTGHVPSTGFTFLTSSCIKPRFPYNPLDHALSIPGFRHTADVLRAIPGGAQFMLFLGDFIYIDVPKRFGVEVEDYRREYRQVYASPDWPAVGQNLSWIHVLDDHEIANDWDRNVTGVYNASVDPVRISPSSTCSFPEVWRAVLLKPHVDDFVHICRARLSLIHRPAADSPNCSGITIKLR